MKKKIDFDSKDKRKGSRGKLFDRKIIEMQLRGESPSGKIGRSLKLGY